MGITMYRNASPDQNNMEHLFNLTSADGGDPAGNSLFNLTTLKTLVTLG